MIPELYTYTNQELIDIIYSLLGLVGGLGIFAFFELLVFIIKSILYKFNKKKGN